MKIQIDDQVLDATPEQIEVVKKIQSNPSAVDIANLKIEEKNKALAKLLALGLTEDEAKAIVG